ncbi:MAG: hypothetical protein WBH47_07780 [Streptosporangiaceae bacterium]
MTLRADEIAHCDESDLDRVWERLTRPIPDGAIAGDTAEWDGIIFEIAEALEPGSARVPGRHARCGASGWQPEHTAERSA